ncbi:hypothetical protein, partial [Paraburkholderia strydomiana]
RARDGDYSVASSKLNAWRPQSRRCETARNLRPETTMQIQPNLAAARLTSHRGYRLRASTRPTRDGWHSADLVIEEPGCPARTFNSLDFFYDDEQAISYATVWELIWVDSRP